MSGSLRETRLREKITRYMFFEFYVRNLTYEMFEDESNVIEN